MHSGDGGVTWERITLGSTAGGTINQIEISQSNNSISVTSSSGQIWASHDGGKSWILATEFLVYNPAAMLLKIGLLMSSGRCSSLSLSRARTARGWPAYFIGGFCLLLLGLFLKVISRVL